MVRHSQQGERAESLHIRIGVTIGLIVAVAFLYAPVRHHPFISFDDFDYVAAHPQVSRGLTWGGFVWAWAGVHGSTWHPITSLSHMLDVAWFGLDPGAHHVVNAVVHAANAVLLFLVLANLTGRTWPSAWVAAVFAVHPLHVESVAWISERKDVLCALFCFLTIGAYARYVRRPSPRRYAVIAFAFALALLSKPMAVTLPFVLLLLDVWPLRRWSFVAPGSGMSTSPSVQRPRRIDMRAESDSAPAAVPVLGLIREKLPLLAMAAVISVVTFVVQRRTGAVMDFEVVPIWGRVANATVAYVVYVFKTIWPANLAVFYPYQSAWPLLQVGGSVVAIAVVTVLSATQVRRRAYALVGWLWFVGMLVPVIGIVQVGHQAMADRYMYLPQIGLTVVVAWGVADLARRWRLAGAVVVVLAIIPLAAAAVVTTRQVALWADDVVLFEHALAVTPRNALAHNTLGTALVARGRYVEAIERYGQAIEIHPGYALAHNNLGEVLGRVGRSDEAIFHYREALRLQPDFAWAHNNMGAAFQAQGRGDDAAASFREALRLDPAYAEAHNNLGVALATRGETAAALEHFEAAVRLRPGFESAQANLERARRALMDE